MATKKRTARLSAREATTCVDRVLAAKGSLEDIALTAHALEVPAWTLLIPGLHEHREFLKAGGTRGLEQLVRGYLAASPARRARARAALGAPGT